MALQIIIALSALSVGIAAFVVAIYRSSAAFRDRQEKKSIERFLRARKAIKEGRETLRRDGLEVTRKKARHLAVSNDVPLLAGEGWLLPGPFPLHDVELRFARDPRTSIDLPGKRLPIRGGYKYNKYSDAIFDIDPPNEFKNRPQYRLLEIDDKRLCFSHQKYSYFDKINYGEYLMLEQSAFTPKKWRIPRQDNRRRLLKRLRTPADYMVLAGVSTLTLIHDGTNLRLLMHMRGQQETASAMGTFHVIPAGEFQPSSLAPPSFKEDFDLWKNMMREYAEELLGMEEHDGNNTIPFNYDAEPFISLESERAASNIKAFYLGTGLDVITLQAEILTVVVFKEETFKKIFPMVLKENREGKIITDENRWGRPFTQEEYDSYETQNILATGEAILSIAWKNREFLKSCLAGDFDASMNQDRSQSRQV